MRSHTGAFLALVAGLSLLTALPAGAQTGNLMGRVTDATTNAPLASAVVQALGAGGSVEGSTLSDRSGTYRLVGLRPGSYTLRVTMAGYARYEAGNVGVTEGETTAHHVTLAATAYELNPIVVTGSRRPERLLDAPARVEVVGTEEIELRPALAPTEHLRSVPGVDIITTGIQSSNVVARGFNNIFSGALYALTDHRIAGIPSLRVNALYMVPSTNEDIERMEIVLGPGAALYGPNTANGVLHMFTRSPLAEQGSVVSVSGGERRVAQTAFRTAHLFGENLGIKVSGMFMRGDEWPGVDEVELAERDFADAQPDFWRQRVQRAEGIEDPAEVQRRFERIAARDETVSRWSGEVRADWRPRPDLTTIFSVGNATTLSGVELTGLGAAQIDDWRYTYYQARANFNRLFAQLYLNTSDAGGTYLLRNGSPIVDRSSLLVGQLQHGVTLGERLNLTYGADYIHTMPRTERTIHGRYEDEDQMTEVGAYLQSETSLLPWADLVVAGRADHHSHLPSLVFSPRAALVLRPAENQSVRLTYNRAFSTPSAINLFLDLGTPFPATAAGASLLGYSIRVQGTGRDGIQIRQPDGSYLMRSPWINDGQTLVGIPSSTALWGYAVSGLHQNLGRIDQETFDFLMTLAGGAGGIPVLTANPQSGALAPLDLLNIPEAPPIEESRTTTYEVGYKGVVRNRVLLAADVWYEHKSNFVTPLMMQTPFVVLDQLSVRGYAQTSIRQHFEDRGYSAEAAADTAQKLATAIGGVPVGVISSEDVFANSAQVLMTYRNFGEVSLWGSDLSATVLLSDHWSFGLGASLVSADHFWADLSGQRQLITLNAPTRKGFTTLSYQQPGQGLSGEARVRYTSGFPASSGVYFGTSCVPDAPATLAGPCVEPYTLLDLTFGYRLRGGTSAQLTVQNALDTAYQSFPGVPQIGRLALFRVRHQF